MDPFALSSAGAAKAVRITPARIGEIVRGHRGIKVDTAVRLALFLGNNARRWMNLQQHCELQHATPTLADAMRSIHPVEASARGHAAIEIPVQNRADIQVTAGAD